MEPKFVVNRNGNTANDIRDDFADVANAALKLQDALVQASSNALHGRNYQTLRGDALAAQNADRSALQAMQVQVDAIRSYAMTSAARAIRQREGL